MEYDILKTLPFDEYHINLITVEHNSPHIGPSCEIGRKLLKTMILNLLKVMMIFIIGVMVLAKISHKNKNIVVTDPSQGTTVKVIQYILDD